MKPKQNAQTKPPAITDIQLNACKRALIREYEFSKDKADATQLAIYQDPHRMKSVYFIASIDGKPFEMLEVWAGNRARIALIGITAIKQRGWKNNAIARISGEELCKESNPHYKTGPSRKLWRRFDIWAAEQSGLHQK